MGISNCRSCPFSNCRLTKATIPACARMSPDLLPVVPIRYYYPCVRPHETLRQEYAPPWPRQGRQRAKRYRERTPAMAADLTEHRWTGQKFLNFPVPAA